MRLIPIILAVAATASFFVEDYLVGSLFLVGYCILVGCFDIADAIKDKNP